MLFVDGIFWHRVYSQQFVLPSPSWIYITTSRVNVIKGETKRR